jgi:hypothetical protein
MDFQNSEAGIGGCEASLDYSGAWVAEAGLAGLPRGVSEVLADPIVQALMAADRVDRKGFEELLRRIAAQLAIRGAGGAFQ